MLQSRLWELESKSHTLGNSTSFVYQIQNLPPGHLVTHFHLTADINVTTAGASGRRPADIVGLLFQFIEHNSTFFKLRATGYGLNRLYHAMNGRQLQNGPSNAGASTGNQRANVVIPLIDVRAAEPEDTAIPSELLLGRTFEVKTSAATAVNIFGAAAVATCQLRLWAEIRPTNKKVAPTPTRIDFTDWSGQTVNMDPGVYSHVAIYKEGDFVSTAATTITPDTEITRVQLTIAGEPVINNVLSWMLVLMFNRTMVAGGFEDNTAEQLDDTAVPFLPVQIPQMPYSLLELPGGTLPAQINLSGTLTTVRVLHRAVMFRSGEATREAARKQFGPGVSVAQDAVTSNGNDIGMYKPGTQALAALLLPAELEAR